MARQITLPIVGEDKFSGTFKKAQSSLENLNSSTSKGMQKISKDIGALPLKFLTLEKAVQGVKASFNFLTDSVSIYEKMSGKAATGGMAKLKQSFGQIQVEIGSVLEPMFKNLATNITNNWDEISKWATNIAGTIPNVVGLFVGLGKIISATFNTIVAGISTAITSIGWTLATGIDLIIKNLPDAVIPDSWVRNVDTFQKTMAGAVKTTAEMTKQSALDIADASKSIATNTVELFKKISNTQRQYAATNLKFETEDQKKLREIKEKNTQDMISSVRQQQIEAAASVEEEDQKQLINSINRTNARTQYKIDSIKRIRAILKTDQEEEIASITANEEAQLQLQKTRQDTAISMAFQYSEMIASISNNVLQTQLNNLSYSATEEEKKIEASFNIRSKYVKNTKKLEEQKKEALVKLQEETYQKEKKIREKGKTGSIASAFISSGEAVMSGWASAMKLGYPANIIAGIASSAIVTAALITQLASINSQKFAAGGEVKGTGSKDTVPVMATPGEWILNERQKSRLYNTVFGSGTSQNNITMGGDTFIINGNLDNGAVNQIKQAKQQRLEQTRQDIKELHYLGQLPMLA